MMDKNKQTKTLEIIHESLMILKIQKFLNMEK